VKEFQELLLEIPSMREQDSLFCFLDGLCGWAKIELERRGVQDLASVIAAAESLMEFKRDSQKVQGKKVIGNGKGEETKTRLPRRTSLPRISGRARRLKHQRNTHVF